MRESCNVAVVKSFAWDRRVAARPTAEIFHTFAWARSWWNAYGPGYEVYTPVVCNSDKAVFAIWTLVRNAFKRTPLENLARDGKAKTPVVVAGLKAFRARSGNA